MIENVALGKVRSLKKGGMHQESTEREELTDLLGSKEKFTRLYYDDVLIIGAVQTLWFKET